MFDRELSPVLAGVEVECVIAPHPSAIGCDPGFELPGMNRCESEGVALPGEDALNEPCGTIERARDQPPRPATHRHAVRLIAHAVEESHRVEFVRKGAFDGLSDFTLGPSVDEVRQRSVTQSSCRPLVRGDRFQLIPRGESECARDSHDERVAGFDDQAAFARNAIHFCERFVRIAAVMQSSMHDNPIEGAIGKAQRFDVLIRPLVRAGVAATCLQIADDNIPESERRKSLDIENAPATDKYSIINADEALAEQATQRPSVHVHVNTPFHLVSKKAMSAIKDSGMPKNNSVREIAHSHVISFSSLIHQAFYHSI